MLRASRSMRVTISTSPFRRKSRTVRNSARFAVLVPDLFSDRGATLPLQGVPRISAFLRSNCKATAHRHPIVEGPPQVTEAKCAASRIRRSSGVVSISTTLGRYFVKGDLSLTSIAGSGRRMVFSVEGGPTEVKCLVFMGSSFRRRRKDVCGGLQLRGATEWDEPGTFIFEWCCQRCGPRPPHGPAAGPAIRPQPGRVSPGVTRRPRAVRSGRPSEGGEGGSSMNSRINPKTVSSSTYVDTSELWHRSIRSRECEFCLIRRTQMYADR